MKFQSPPSSKMLEGGLFVVSVDIVKTALLHMEPFSYILLLKKLFNLSLFCIKIKLSKYIRNRMSPTIASYPCRRWANGQM